MENLLIGQTIDHYEIVDILGHGGMGTVFKATDKDLDRYAALKIMDSRLSKSEDFLRRFRTEGRFQARLEHPNIVTVYALRESEIGLYIAMEYVEGETLAERIRRVGAIPWSEAVSLFKPVLSAIDYAHRKAIIHRDIKPANILIDRSGRVKVTDFGLAKMHQDVGLTSTGSSGGTIVYASPEQIRSLKNASFSSDVYSLGMTFYQMLAGKLPFSQTDSNLTIQLAIIEGKILPPDQLNPDIPRGLVRIINKAIHVEPAKRYQNAGEFLKALKDFGTARDIKFDSTVSTFPPVKPPRQRFSIKKTLPAILLLLFIAAMVIFDVPQHVQKILFPPATPPAETYLIVESQPEGAEVFLNNEKIGFTPLEKRLNTTGESAFIIQKDGYFTLDTTVMIPAEERSSLSVKLRQAASASIQVDPRDAIVFIDEIAYNASELADLKLPPGIHSIRIEHPAYERYSGEISLIHGQNPLSFSLKPTPSPTATTLSTGQLSIISDPAGAAIRIDDQDIAGAVTPYSIEEISEGVHELHLTKDGFADYFASVTVTAGKANGVTAELIALTGSAFIESDPADAAIWLNNREVPNVTTPARLPGLSAGRHTVLLRKTGYVDFSTTIEITANSRAAVNAVLVPATGKIGILCLPYGSIYIDGKLKARDRNTRYIATLPTGSHEIKIEHPSFGNWQKTVEIRPGEITNLSIDFNKFFNLTVTAFDESKKPVFADIYVDGQPTGFTTPRRWQLRLGTHRIEVRKAGYSPVTPPQILTLEQDLATPLKFTLRKTN